MSNNYEESKQSFQLIQLLLRDKALACRGQWTHLAHMQASNESLSMASMSKAIDLVGSTTDKSFVFSLVESVSELVWPKLVEALSFLGTVHSSVATEVKQDRR